MQKTSILINILVKWRETQLVNKKIMHSKITASHIAVYEL